MQEVLGEFVGSIRYSRVDVLSTDLHPSFVSKLYHASVCRVEGVGRESGSAHARSDQDRWRCDYRSWLRIDRGRI